MAGTGTATQPINRQWIIHACQFSPGWPGWCLRGGFFKRQRHRCAVGINGNHRHRWAASVEFALVAEQAISQACWSQSSPAWYYPPLDSGSMQVRGRPGDAACLALKRRPACYFKTLYSCWSCIYSKLYSFHLNMGVVHVGFAWYFLWAEATPTK